MMLFPPFDENTARYERKFVQGELYHWDIQQIVRNHPAAFHTIHYPRYINNIYLDTTEMDFYFDNVSGKGSRKKARIRWYGDLKGEVHSPVLEFKTREGMLGNKLSFILHPFTFGDEFSREQLQNIFDKSTLPDWVREVLALLKPALLNRYMREYYLSFDHHFRLTIDHELSYFAIGNQNDHFLEKITSADIIVELKYNAEVDKKAAAVTNALPFRLSKSSKYVNGFELFHPHAG